MNAQRTLQIVVLLLHVATQSDLLFAVAMIITPEMEPIAFLTSAMTRLIRIACREQNARPPPQKSSVLALLDIMEVVTKATDSPTVAPL